MLHHKFEKVVGNVRLQLYWKDVWFWNYYQRQCVHCTEFFCAWQYKCNPHWRWWCRSGERTYAAWRSTRQPARTMELVPLPMLLSEPSLLYWCCNLTHWRWCLISFAKKIHGTACDMLKKEVKICRRVSFVLLHLLFISRCQIYVYMADWAVQFPFVWCTLYPLMLWLYWKAAWWLPLVWLSIAYFT